MCPQPIFGVANGKHGRGIARTHGLGLKPGENMCRRVPIDKDSAATSLIGGNGGQTHAHHSE